MHYRISLAVLFAALSVIVCAAPCPHLHKRQDVQSVPADFEDASAAMPADTADSIAAAPVVNSVGNSDTTIDDSINLTDNSIDYPDDSQLTGNTGTAVSGNNNDIMPIINAPVTVIINNNDQPHPLRQNVPPVMTPGANIAQQQPFTQQQPRSSAQLQPMNPYPPGTPLPPAPQQASADPFDSHVQQLIAYALALSQRNIAQAV